MKKLNLYFIFALLLFIFSGTNSPAATKLFGPEKSDDAELPTKIKAVKLSYDKSGENMIAKGRVEIEQGSRLLKADYVKINLETKDTEAKGNVELNENGDILHCDAFNINLDTQMGHVENAKLFLKQDNLHITGKEIKKLGLSTYEINNGTITTCDTDSPAWRIDAKKINVTVDGYATVDDSTFRIKKIPVAYLPFAFVPVKTSRQSGFLFPEISQSSSKGFEFNNSFFWAMSENTDSTIWLDAASTKGPGAGLEYRFKLKEDSWGKFYGYFADESSQYIHDEYRDKKDRSPQRGYMNFEGEHYFNQDAYIKAQGSYTTDRQFYDDYSKEVRRTKAELDQPSISTRPYDESLVFFNKNFDWSNLLINTEYYKDLNSRDKTTAQPVPEIAFSTMRMPLADSMFFYKFDTAYNYFYSGDGNKGNRLDAYPRISLPLNHDGWLKFDTEVGVRALAYKVQDDHGVNNSAVFPTIDSKLSADFVRVYSIDGKILQKLRHTLEPALFYQYTASDDQDDLPSFDVPDNFYKTHRVGYYLKNRFAGLFNTPTGENEDGELGYFLIGQAYNISHPTEGYYDEGNRNKDYSDVFTDLRVNFGPRVYFRTEAAYVPYDHSLRYFKSLITWSNELDEHFMFGYVDEKNRFEGWRARGRFKLMHSLYAFFHVRYNNNKSDDKINAEYGIDYFAQCWGSQFSIETRAASSGRRADTSFNYKFYLRGLGNTTKKGFED